jgi:hypothetical protein
MLLESLRRALPYEAVRNTEHHEIVDPKNAFAVDGLPGHNLFIWNVHGYFTTGCWIEAKRHHRARRPCSSCRIFDKPQKTK